MIRIGIAGYGNLGRGVESALTTTPDMELVGVFTRRDPKTMQTKTDAPVYAMEQAKAEGYDAVRFLVGAQNLPAQRAYAGFQFDVCGEADAWGDHWLCYQKRL